MLRGCRWPSKPSLQKLIDGEWITMYRAIELMCSSPPWYLEPSDVFQDTLYVWAQMGSNTLEVPVWENGAPVDGAYRLERSIFTGDRSVEDPSELLPLRERVSQTFRIHAHLVTLN